MLIGGASLKAPFQIEVETPTGPGFLEVTFDAASRFWSNSYGP